MKINNNNSRWRFWLAVGGWVLLWASAPALAEGGVFGSWSLFDKRAPVEVTVNDAFINVYNAPGRGYPIFHALERGETITLLKMHTDWIKIRTARGIEGWIKRSDVLLTLGPDQQVPEFADSQQADYLADRFELGAAFGDFAGAKAFDVNLGYRFTKNLSAELRLAQNTGDYSDSKIVALALLHQPFPEWRVSPYLGIATGTITTAPSATLVQTQDRSDHLLQANIGCYVHISGRLFLRAEYSNDYLLTSRNTNQEVNEWKLGLNVFF